MLPGTNRLAITALVGSIVGFVGFGSVLGLVLGFVALREVEQEGEKRCDAAFSLLPTEKTEHLGITFLYPTNADWHRTQAITCIAVEPNGTSTTSLVG